VTIVFCQIVFIEDFMYVYVMYGIVSTLMQLTHKSVYHL